jgi:hypothetical protein
MNSFAPRTEQSKPMHNPENMTALISERREEEEAFKFEYFIFNYAFYMHLHGCLSLLPQIARSKPKNGSTKVQRMFTQKHSKLSG